MSILKTFGFRDDGTLSVCYAAPAPGERSHCNHIDHIEISEAQLRKGMLTEHNLETDAENLKRLGRKKYLESVSRKRAAKIKRRMDQEKRKSKGGSHAPEELEREAQAILYEEDGAAYATIFRFLESFNATIPFTGKALKDTERLELLVTFMRSNNPRALKLREFLGENIDLQKLAELLVYPVGSMTNKHFWSSNNPSVNRAILSQLAYDMDVEKYTRSVLFFKGCCCYCGRQLDRNSDKSWEIPTGEHLTPVTPRESHEPFGATRYGNMVLACSSCNSARQSIPIGEWLASTNRVHESVKAHSLAKIYEFRELARYEEFNDEEQGLIRGAIDRVSLRVNDIRDQRGAIVSGHGDEIRALVNQELQWLSSQMGYEFQSN